MLIWDEAPMQRRWVMECVDRTLRVLLESEEPFGGKVMLFCGDFRQVAPVIPRAGRAQIISQSLPMSNLWNMFKPLKLTINERINQNTDGQQKAREKEFAEFLLDIGDGTYPNEHKVIAIPKRIDCHFRSVDAFIQSVFGKLSNYNPEKLNRQFLHRAILTPKNVHVTELNELAMQQLKGDFHAPYKAIDTLELESQNCNYPKEWLQKLQINGMPEWQLDLKLGAPIMVLRNLDPFNGVCNGTKGIITAMEKHVIQMAILSNDSDDDDVKHVFIPRISLIPSDPQIPVQFKRHQFPIRVAFAT